MIDQIIAYNKDFVAQKGYEKYLRKSTRSTSQASIPIRNWRYYHVWTPA